MVDAMIATAFLTNDMEKILDAGAAALDPKSVMSQIMSDVRRWYQQNPRDWRATRKLTKDKYCKYGGQDMRDRNGVWLNGASTVSALLYGDGDWVQTVRGAFNFGWDADNNAAASGTILGVIKGNKALRARAGISRTCTATPAATTCLKMKPSPATATGWSRLRKATSPGAAVEDDGSGKSVYRIPVEKAANVEPLPDLKKQHAAMRAQLKSEIEKGVLSGAHQEKARAAYLAICLDFAPELKQKHAEQWPQAIHALAGYPRVLQVIFFEAPFPAGESIRQKSLAAGLQKPATNQKLWE